MRFPSSEKWITTSLLEREKSELTIAGTLRGQNGTCPFSTHMRENVH